jgi:hypothetical protein
MTYLGTQEEILMLLDDEGFPTNIKIKDYFQMFGRLYINHNTPSYKAVMIDLTTRIATLAY